MISVPRSRRSLAPSGTACGWCRIELELTVDAGAEPELLRRTLARTLARAIARRLDRAADGVLFFPDRIGYLARFLADLAAGDAWHLWYYEAFAGLRVLPVAAALRTAILAEPERGLQALARLASAELARTLEALSPAEAERVLDGLAALTGEADARRPARPPDNARLAAGLARLPGAAGAGAPGDDGWPPAGTRPGAVRPRHGAAAPSARAGRGSPNPSDRGQHRLFHAVRRALHAPAAPGRASAWRCGRLARLGRCAGGNPGACAAARKTWEAPRHWPSCSTRSGAILALRRPCRPRRSRAGPPASRRPSAGRCASGRARSRGQIGRAARSSRCRAGSVTGRSTVC